jgi:catechol 2,3-dioxygenase-like lactoylglutathione lyase family enzyme
MSTITDLVPGIRSFRPFLPAKDFETSLRFYEAIGFKAHKLGDTLAELSLGPHAFLLQGCYVREWAENTVMHVLVDDVQAWWRYINSLDLANQFGVSPPAPPRVEPWGLTVTYVFDPAGVLWHFAEVTRAEALTTAQG